MEAYFAYKKTKQRFVVALLNFCELEYLWLPKKLNLSENSIGL